MYNFTMRMLSTVLRAMSGKRYSELLRQLVLLHGPKHLLDVITPDIQLTIPPGHFYSPYPDIPLVQARWNRIFGASGNCALGVREDVEKQLDLAEELEPLIVDFPYSLSADRSEVAGTFSGQPLRYRCHQRNRTFHLDAVVLQAMLRYFKPNRIVEVGSGYSSAIMLDVREQQGWVHQELTFIEPYAQAYFFPLLKPEDRASIRIIEQPLWDADRQIFESLEAGDLLFIDSSHVAKIGSDVYDYLFDILPRLKPGVLIHVHDIAANYEIAPTWFENGWYWNEGAFLRAFLMFNDVFSVLFHSNLLYQAYPESPGVRSIVAQALNTFVRREWQWTNSFYLRRKLEVAASSDPALDQVRPGG